MKQTHSQVLIETIKPMHNTVWLIMKNANLTQPHHSIKHVVSLVQTHLLLNQSTPKIICTNDIYDHLRA